jgi:hypothetical protein
MLSIEAMIHIFALWVDMINDCIGIHWIACCEDDDFRNLRQLFEELFAKWTNIYASLNNKKYYCYGHTIFYGDRQSHRTVI